MKNGGTVPSRRAGAFLLKGLGLLEDGDIGGVSMCGTCLERVAPRLLPGDLVVLASVPGGGKTSLALNIAAGLVLADVPRRVGVVTLDHTQPQLMARMLGCMTGVSPAGAAGFVPLMEAAKRLGTAPLYLSGMRCQSAVSVFATMRELRQRRRAEVLFLDSLLHVQWPKRMTAEWHHPEDPRGLKLKRLAERLGVTVVVLTSLGGRYVHVSDRPTIWDLAGHHYELAQYADVVALLHQAGPMQKDGQPVELWMAKNRRGPSDVNVPMFFQPGSGKFVPRQNNNG